MDELHTYEYIQRKNFKYLLALLDTTYVSIRNVLPSSYVRHIKSYILTLETSDTLILLSFYTRYSK